MEEESICTEGGREGDEQLGMFKRINQNNEKNFFQRKELKRKSRKNTVMLNDNGNFGVIFNIFRYI